MNKTLLYVALAFAAGIGAGFYFGHAKGKDGATKPATSATPAAPVTHNFTGGQAGRGSVGK